jgi:hypothetical protein
MSLYWRGGIQDQFTAINGMVNKGDNTDRQGSYDEGSITYYTRCHLDHWGRQHRFTETETTEVKVKIDWLESNRSEYQENERYDNQPIYPVSSRHNRCNGLTPVV